MRDAYQVFKTLCHDGDPSKPWKHQMPLAKTALSPDHIALRDTWREWMEWFGYTEDWYFQELVWVDPCNTVIPNSPRAVFDHQQLASNGRGRSLGRIYMYDDLIALMTCHHTLHIARENEGLVAST